jgi:hypothetical protein
LRRSYVRRFLARGRSRRQPGGGENCAIVYRIERKRDLVVERPRANER